MHKSFYKKKRLINPHNFSPKKVSEHSEFFRKPQINVDK